MAELKNGKVVVSKDFEPIAEQGFGEKEGGMLVLAPFEALYLVEKKKIEINKKNKKIDFASLISEFKKKNKKIRDLYLVFKDLRVSGYVARDGKTEIPSFRVYARGSRPEEEPARYLVWVIDGRGKTTLKELRGMLERAHAVRKRAVFAVVEKGTITYFKIDTTKF